MLDNFEISWADWGINCCLDHLEPRCYVISHKGSKIHFVPEEFDEMNKIFLRALDKVAEAEELARQRENNLTQITKAIMES